MKIDGVEAVIHRGVLRRRSEDTKYSHYAGTPSELKQTVLFAWHGGRFRRSLRKGAIDTYEVTVPEKNFFTKVGATPLSDRPDNGPEPRWHKYPAGSAVVIVRLKRISPTGAVEVLEIIDLQAFPRRARVAAGESRSSIQL